MPEVFSIGECRIYPAGNELHRGNTRVQLEPKVMALLCHLAQNAGDTLSREQLFEALWPGVIVSDDTLTQAIIKLRKALGDSARNPKYIQTVPKRGYRLVAAVDSASDGVGSVPLNRRRWTYFLAAGLALLIFGVITAYILPVDVTETSTDVVTAPDAPPDGLPTLTVHPFALIGEDTAHAYLAQGLTFDLITDLSKLSGLWVIGSRSIMGQRSEEPETVSARYQVSGEVQRAHGQLRVNVHLLDKETGRQIWSERYHRPFENLFQIQEEISRRIASTLSLKVTEAEQLRLAHSYTHNVQAYEHFLQAQALLLVRTQAGNEKARQLYRQAIALDPSFARAYAGLALSFAADYRNQWAADGNEALEQARRMARTALQINPEIPEIYWVLAYVNTQHREHERALGLLRKAISLDQSFADAYALMGGINTYLGRSEETPGLLRTAIRLNPDAGYLYFLLLGRAYFYLQDWEQALINLNEALVRNSASLEAHVYLAAVMEMAGDHEGAVWEAEEIRSLRGDFDLQAWLGTYPMTDQEQTDQLLTALAPLDLVDQ